MGFAPFLHLKLHSCLHTVWDTYTQRSSLTEPLRRIWGRYGLRAAKRPPPRFGGSGLTASNDRGDTRIAVPPTVSRSYRQVREGALGTISGWYEGYLKWVVGDGGKPRLRLLRKGTLASE